MSVFRADIMGRVRHLTVEIIYPKMMLCITRNLFGTENITIDGFDHIQYCPFYWTPRYRIVLSCSLLDRMMMEGRILFSLTNFITTQELSGPFYISPNIYHTQITEYSLMTFYEWALFSLHSSSKIFLIVIMLDLTHFRLPSNETGALWITSPVLFQLKRLFFYSDQFLRNPLCMITLRNWSLICWRLLLSGLRSVIGNATDSLKSFRLTMWSTLGTWFQTAGLVLSLPAWTSSSSYQRKISVNAAFHNFQIVYIANIPAIFTRRTECLHDHVALPKQRGVQPYQLSRNWLRENSSHPKRGLGWVPPLYAYVGISWKAPCGANCVCVLYF